jgi:cyclopropane fatty-acyl-phospholipid synthase-like methyltransferase
MPSRARSALRAWRSFAGAGARTRAFLLARLVTVPRTALERELPAGARVLSLGSGHGLVERYLAERDAEATFEGVDLDAERVAVAERSASRVPRVRVREADVTKLEVDDAYDAALAVDVLHHVSADRHAEVLTALHRALRPGGVLLIKDIATTPRWRYEFNRLHDRVVAGPEPIHCRAPDEMARIAEAAGFQVERVRRVGRVSPYPHYLVRLRRP